MSTKSINNVMEFLDGFLYEIPKDKQHLIELIESMELEEYEEEIGNEVWTIETVIKEINKWDYKKFNSFKKSIINKIEFEMFQNELGSELIEKFTKLYPDESIFLETFLLLGEDEYFIEMDFANYKHGLEFTGTIDEMVEALSEKMEEHINDITSCPFCNLEQPRYKWYNRLFCDCGSEICMEKEKKKEERDGKMVWVGELEDKLRHDPDYKFTGKREGLGLYFKKPNPTMILSGTLDERKQVFADYLRHRQRLELEDMGVEKEMLDSLSDQDIMESYRICSGCGHEKYTEQDRNTALLESTSFDSAFDFMDKMAVHHYEKEMENEDLDED